MIDQLDLFGALSAKQAAFDRLMLRASDWMPKARAALRVSRFHEGTGEQMRLILLEEGLPPPHHHNVWGAFVSKALDAGLLIVTNRREHMATVRSHGRMSDVLHNRCRQLEYDKLQQLTRLRSSPE